MTALPLNFIELWAERKPGRRWPIVFTGLVATILTATSLDFYAERAEFQAACKARKQELVTLASGDLACRQPRGART